MEHGENYSRPPPNLIDNNKQYKVKTIHNHQHHGRWRQLQYLIKWLATLIRQYHRQHPLMAIKASSMMGKRYQLSWVVDALNSMLSQRDLQSYTSTSLPSSALTHTQPTNLWSFNPTSRSTSHTCTTPNTPTSAMKPTAQPIDKCWTKYRTNRPPPPTTCPY